ncbi:MAG TPA: hypothetical protein VGK29_14675 [Paludibaculum sp.]|jgi:hypothetical protein
MTQAEAAIERFRSGERFRPPASSFLGGEASGELLGQLGGALESEPGAVRVEIVKLLADLAWRADPSYGKGGRVIHDEATIHVLVKGGLAHVDVGRDAALEVLKTYVPAELLRPHGRALTADLQHAPDSTALHVIAKAKPPEASVLVRRLLATSRWSREESARVAAAALGDRAIEQEFIAAFASATDGRQKVHLAKVLGWIGTGGALQALAQQMRTGVVLEVPMALRRSARLDIIGALGYNFPDEVLLYESAIRSDADYARIEEWCERRFHVRWDRERPPFLTVQGFPIPVRP